MKSVLLIIVIIVVLALSLGRIIMLEGHLSDYKFEINHLQTKITRLEALGEYETALYQLMPALAWAQLRAANEILKQECQWEFEGREMPLLMEKGSKIK